MKSLLSVFFILTFSITSFGNNLDNYSKLELRALPDTESSYNFDIGILHERTPYKVYGIYGVNEKEGEKEKTALLGKLVLSSWSLGIMSNISASKDNVLSIRKIEGLKLKSLCSNYHGVGFGLALIAGGDASSTINSDGVVIASNKTVYGLVKLNISYKKVKIKCLDLENPNWDKTVRFL